VKTAFVQDRLGSAGKYYPYGEARGTVPQDAVGFATYTNDSATGLEYADQRYYASNFGRYMSVDRTWYGTDSSRPASWNRYAYVEGDPANYNDPLGTFLGPPLPPPVPDPDPNLGGAGASVAGCTHVLAKVVDSGNCPQVHFGGGNPDKFITNSQMKQELGQAIVVALHALGTNSKCAGLFGLTGSAGNTSPIAQQVLSDLFPAGNVLQYFDFARISSNGNFVTSATTQGVGSNTVSIGNGATMTVNASVIITLNNTTGGTAFVSGNQNDWAITFLHELGHVYTDLYGPGTSKIVPDAGNPQQSIDNTQLIEKDCNLQGQLQ
jgi:RHS repeat-associated protein